MKRRLVLGLAAALAMSVALPAAWAQDTVQIANIAELSGPGATAGVNWRDGAKMAIEEINAAGGILGKQVEMPEYDSQSDAQTSRAMVQKAIDEGAFALLGTVYSGSTIVNMLVAQQAGIPQFTGSESARITAMGNPYIFRTSFGSQKSMPKIAAVHAGRDGREEGRRRLGQHRVRQGRLRRLHRRDGGPRHRDRRRRARPRTPRPTSPPTSSR